MPASEISEAHDNPKKLADLANEYDPEDERSIRLTTARLKSSIKEICTSEDDGIIVEQLKPLTQLINKTKQAINNIWPSQNESLKEENRALALTLLDLRDEINRSLRNPRFKLSKLLPAAMKSHLKDFMNFCEGYMSLTEKGTNPSIDARRDVQETLPLLIDELQKEDVPSFLRLMHTYYSIIPSHASDPLAKFISDLDAKLGLDKNPNDFGLFFTFVCNNLPDMAQNKFDSLFKGYGLPTEQILEIWRMTPEFTIRNFAAMTLLEKTEPGTCAKLFRSFGIADFARYPKEMLIRQAQRKERIGKEHGVIIFPRSDWNGAFNESYFSLREMNGAINSQLDVDIYECGSKLDFIKALVKSNRDYGRRISFAIIGGHGTKGSIQFGQSNSRFDQLTLEDLTGPGAKRGGSKFFDEGSTIILKSCSTGKDEGIGQRLSELTHGKVIAPDTPTNIQEYRISRATKGDWNIDVTYNNNSSKRTYANGAEVHNIRGPFKEAA